MLELASSELSWLTRPAVSWPAPDAPLCDLPLRVSIMRYPTISPRSLTGSKDEPQTGV